MAERGFFCDFATKAIGTVGWTLHHKGVACDAIGGSANSSYGNEFVQRRLPAGKRSVRFDLSAHGEEHASILARAWCHKLQYFLDAEIADQRLCRRGVPMALIQEYEEPSEFQRLAARATAETRKRVQQIRETFSTP